ncbi:hypothetical protein ACJX0J_024240, partial [Zea mays]
GTPGQFMTDEDVVVFNGMKEAVSDVVHLGSIMLEALMYNKCATLFYAFPYLRTDMLHLTDIILFLVCAYDANLKQVTVVATCIICSLIVADSSLLKFYCHTDINFAIQNLIVSGKDLFFDITCISTN